MRIRKILGILLGAIVALEGILMMFRTSTIDFPGIGIVLPQMSAISAFLFIILGSMISACWLLKDDERIVQRKQFTDVIKIIGLTAPAMIVLQSLLIISDSKPFLLEEGASLNLVDIGLLSAHLFALGILGLGLWFRREMKNGNDFMWFLGALSSIFFMSFGLVLVGCNADMTLEDGSMIASSTVLLGGISLMLFGTITYLSWLLSYSKYYHDGYHKVIDLIFFMINLLVILLAVMMVMLSSNFEMGDFFSGRKTWFAYWSTLLFFFGTLSMFAWIGKGHRMTRRNAAWTAGSLLALMFPAEGILIMGLSGQTIVQGVGIIYQSNAFWIGYPLIALGINLNLAWHINNNEYFRNEHNRNLLDMMLLFCLALLFAGGLMIIARASTLIIDGVGTLSESIVISFGAQMAMLAFMILYCWVQRQNGSTPKFKRVMVLGMMFLLLLVPPVLFL